MSKSDTEFGSSVLPLNINKLLQIQQWLINYSQTLIGFRFWTVSVFILIMDEIVFMCQKLTCSYFGHTAETLTILHEPHLAPHILRSMNVRNDRPDQNTNMLLENLFSLQVKPESAQAKSVVVLQAVISNSHPATSCIQRLISNLCSMKNQQNTWKSSKYTDI